MDTNKGERAPACTTKFRQTVVSSSAHRKLISVSHGLRLSVTQAALVRAIRNDLNILRNGHIDSRQLRIGSTTVSRVSNFLMRVNMARSILGARFNNLRLNRIGQCQISQGASRRHTATQNGRLPRHLVDFQHTKALRYRVDTPPDNLFTCAFGRILHHRVRKSGTQGLTSGARLSKERVQGGRLKDTANRHDENDRRARYTQTNRRTRVTKLSTHLNNDPRTRNNQLGRHAFTRTRKVERVMNRYNQIGSLLARTAIGQQDDRRARDQVSIMRTRSTNPQDRVQGT